MPRGRRQALQSRNAACCRKLPIEHRMRRAMKSILDRTFRYTPSFETDLRKTFARIQRERRLAEQSERSAARQPLANVSSIVRNSAVRK
jgi:hypothetical protein